MANKLKFRKFKDIKEEVNSKLKYYTGEGCGEIYISVGHIKVKCGTKRKEFGDILLCSSCGHNKFHKKKIEQDYPILFAKKQSEETKGSEQ